MLLNVFWYNVVTNFNNVVISWQSYFDWPKFWLKSEITSWSLGQDFKIFKKCTISPGLMDSVEPRQYTTILLSGLMTLTFSGGHKEDRVVGETGAALAQTTGEAGQSQYHAKIHRVQVSAPHPWAFTQQPEVITQQPKVIT